MYKKEDQTQTQNQSPPTPTPFITTPSLLAGLAGCPAMRARNTQIASSLTRLASSFLHNHHQRYIPMFFFYLLSLLLDLCFFYFFLYVCFLCRKMNLWLQSYCVDSCWFWFFFFYSQAMVLMLQFVIWLEYFEFLYDYHVCASLCGIIVIIVFNINF